MVVAQLLNIWDPNRLKESNCTEYISRQFPNQNLAAEKNASGVFASAKQVTLALSESLKLCVREKDGASGAL